MIRLDTPRRVGGFVVAAITRQSAQCVPGGCIGTKTPLAVLIATGQTVQAFDPEGRALTDQAVEKLLPGARDKIAALGAARDAKPTR
jgi:hypothetical protein